MSKQKKFLGSFGLALVVAIGFATVYAIAGGWCISVWEGLSYEPDIDESVRVMSDGTPLIHRYTYNASIETESFRTLDGKDVTPKERDEVWLFAAFLPLPRYHIGMFPLVGARRIGRFSDAQDVLWYFVDDGARDGRGYFVGYDSQSKLRVGFIGRNGYRQDEPPVDDWFPMNGVKLISGAAMVCRGQGAYWYRRKYYFDRSSHGNFPDWKVEMISGEQLLQVDLRSRSVTTFMESPGLLAAGNLDAPAPKKAAKDNSEEAPRTKTNEFLAVRTGDRIVVLDGAGKQHSAYAIPAGFRDQNFSLYEIGKDSALLTSGFATRDHIHTHGEELTWTDASGQVLRSQKVVLQGGGGSDERRDARLAAAVVPSPIALAFGATVLLPIDDMFEGKPESYFTHLAHHLTVFAVPLLLVTVLSAALAVFCWRRNRHSCQPASVFWLVFVLITGLPGLAGYLFHRRWPVLEVCPACGRMAPRDRDACAACGAEFPPPPLKGIEVFA